MKVMRLPSILVILTVVLVSCAPDREPSVERGYQAYEQGNHARALREWRPLAEAGDVVAQNHLGLMYDQGHGVDQDYAEAMRWYRLAAEQGLAQAQFNVGDMHEAGDGAPQDHAEAMRWYRLAAEQGHAKAQNSLGTIYKSGLGGQQDYNEAIHWFRLAAEQGDGTAMMNLGELYYRPFSPSQLPRDMRDPVLGHKWLNLATAHNIEKAVLARNLTEISMTPAQIAEAQKLAREWLAKQE